MGMSGCGCGGMRQATKVGVGWGIVVAWGDQWSARDCIAIGLIAWRFAVQVIALGVASLRLMGRCERSR